MDPTFLYEIWNKLTRHIDGKLMAIVLLLMAVGCITLFSALSPDTDRFMQQIKNIAFALVVMWLVANTPPQRIMQIAIPLYLVGVLLLIGVAVYGVTVNGSQRWLAVGRFRFQPSELLKLAVPLMLAWYFQRHEGRINAFNFIVAIVLILIPVGLIRKQPDLGTALMVTASGFFVLYLARLPWKVILASIIGGIAVVLTFAKPYQIERLKSFLYSIFDPAAVDLAGAGYHAQQAKIAIGSGGLFGKGWLHGTQTHLDFLPEHHTDFIIAAFSEEFGLVGIALLLLLFTALLLRALIIAHNANSLFERLLAGSITLMLFTYTFVNIGMVSGLLPVIGVPLPFLSYGGTALLTVSICVGILMSIQTHHKLMGQE